MLNSGVLISYMLNSGVLISYMQNSGVLISYMQNSGVLISSSKDMDSYEKHLNNSCTFKCLSKNILFNLKAPLSTVGIRLTNVFPVSNLSFKWSYSHCRAAGLISSF